MKIHYFFVTATLEFYCQYVNSGHRYYPPNNANLKHKEVYGIEQSESQSDSDFFENLKINVIKALEAYAQSWIDKCNPGCKSIGGEWKLIKLEIENISKVS